MEIELELMPENVTVTSRATSSPIHDLLSVIASDEAYHGRLLKLATFSLPGEKGKAHTQKQNMTNTYGTSPAIAGFDFVVTRAVDNSAEYLGVTFDPNKIVPGAYESFLADKRDRIESAKARKADRALKAEARAEIKAMEQVA